MTMRDYPSGDQQPPTGYGYGANNYPPNRQGNPSPQSFNQQNNSGYPPYPPSGANPSETNYNYNSGNQSYPAQSGYPQSQPWAGPSPSPGNYYQQPDNRSYQNPPYGGQPPYSPSSPQQAGYGQHPPPYSPQPTGSTDTPNAEPEEKDRGFLGAVAGGAAGAYGGHKVNHGFLGAIGGAISGSVAQDAMKKHKEKKEEEEKKKQWAAQQAAAQQHAQQQAQLQAQQQAQQHAMLSQPPHHGPPRHDSTPLRGNFSASSRDIRLEGGHELVAHCGAISGQMRPSSIPLNSVLSNQFGKLVWARNGNFAASARNIRLVEGGKVLEAELANGRGGWDRSWVRLDERISNQNGNLVFLD
ncbi:glutamine-serine-proline rich protein [Aspergillus nomiae NRRL 13137]|uniref:Glutamine-serine-proline rich protein n=1 Tax=Aspergillus nomiae NRRL (strain ATCC 15546 / NRRL 13137 / CBS 260.88 / M93) TaxID=1509407 RepID=A0A0L1IKC0_ASPN3|nr:glutamine-serine-proline rich protein [Aspergillus nomiae NRRL 13137]KNG80036.1 glutamine-serine-proline rich protein [Aspergillus nomiae NRRL 13137]